MEILSRYQWRKSRQDAGWLWFLGSAMDTMVWTVSSVSSWATQGLQRPPCAEMTGPGWETPDRLHLPSLGFFLQTSDFSAASRACSSRLSILLAPRCSSFQAFLFCPPPPPSPPLRSPSILWDTPSGGFGILGTIFVGLSIITLMSSWKIHLITGMRWWWTQSI